jgi:DNA-binding transcriptional LysR family regulator
LVELRQLRCFVAVAEEQSFARAAERLLFATSNVSQHVRQLERELDVKLLDRNSRHVALTAAGQVLFDCARHVLSEAEAMVGVARQAALGQIGSLHAAACPGAGHLVAEFVRVAADAYPDLQVAFATLQTAEVVAAVSAGRLSLGIARSTAPELASLVLSQEPQSYVAIPSGHRLAALPELRIEDLDGEAVIVIDEHTHRYFHDEAVRFFRGQNVEPDFQPFPIKTVEQCIELVAARRGVALVTHTTVESYPRRGTVIRPLAGPAPVTEHHLLWRRDDDSPQVAALVKVAQDRSW